LELLGVIGWFVVQLSLKYIPKTYSKITMLLNGATTLSITIFSILTFTIMTISITKISIMTISITTISIMPISITTISITTISIMTLILINKIDTQHYGAQYCFAECRK
jgi:hypothetical protein